VSFRRVEKKRLRGEKEGLGAKRCGFGGGKCNSETTKPGESAERMLGKKKDIGESLSCN